MTHPCCIKVSLHEKCFKKKRESPFQVYMKNSFVSKLMDLFAGIRSELQKDVS